ncbi:hypothetical protein BDR03DRAFT_971385, partial [Suillus americanus]
SRVFSRRPSWWLMSILSRPYTLEGHENNPFESQGCGMRASGKSSQILRIPMTMGAEVQVESKSK